jgi:hypothetical protein
MNFVLVHITPFTCQIWGFCGSDYEDCHLLDVILCICSMGISVSEEHPLIMLKVDEGIKS